MGGREGESGWLVVVLRLGRVARVRRLGGGGRRGLGGIERGLHRGDRLIGDARSVSSGEGHRRRRVLGLIAIGIGVGVGVLVRLAVRVQRGRARRGGRAVLVVGVGLVL